MHNATTNAGQGATIRVNDMDTTEMLELSQEFAELGRELHGDGDNDAALHRMVELAVKQIDGCSWASITIVRGETGHTLALSDAVAGDVDLIQYSLREGPCLQAAEDEVNYLLFDVENEPRWPRFAAAVAEQTAVRSVLSIQLMAGRAACLNLYADKPGAFSDDAIDTATIFGAHTSTLVALHDAQQQATNLEVALSSSREIGVALGVLMAHHRVTQDQAFAMLRSSSQSLHRKLRDVAGEVVETGALPGT